MIKISRLGFFPEKNRTTEKMLMRAGVLILLLVIWKFSSQPAAESSAVSGGISRKIAVFFCGMPTESEYHFFEVLVRKTAHMSEFAALFMMFAHAVWLDNGRHPVRDALIATLLAASSDELHQSFVPGRSCMFTDVLIDMMGTGFAVIIRHYAIAIYGFFRKSIT